MVLMTKLLDYFKDITHITEASKSMLRYLILNKCDEIIKRGCVTVEELEELEEMNVPYKKLKGNGTAKLMLGKVERLPIKKGVVTD
ncbi:MAG: hypothetical protein ACK5KQ_01435 [Anaerorhabdus sp.]